MKDLTNINGWSHIIIITMMSIMIFAISSCSKKDIKIELTPSCLISLSELKNEDVIKLLTKDGWTRYSGVYTDYTYKKSGIDGNVELMEKKNLDERVVRFSTESDALYRQWYKELESMGYNFKDVSEFKGLHELLCEPKSEGTPVITLIFSDIYSDADFTNVIGHSYSMFTESISINQDK